MIRIVNHVFNGVIFCSHYLCYDYVEFNATLLGKYSETIIMSITDLIWGRSKRVKVYDLRMI